MNTPSNIKNECYTPSSLLTHVRRFSPIIHLDPFSTEEANKTVCAKHYFSEADNALNLNWLDYTIAVTNPFIWVNPPYSRNLVSPCVTKTLEYRGSAEILLLLNSQTSAKYYQRCLNDAKAILFLSKRLQFVNPYSEFNHSNSRDSTLFYFGYRISDFINVFNDLGMIIQPW